MKKLDLICGLFLLGLGIAILLKSLTYPIGTFRAPGGGLFPLLTSILLMALALVLTIQTFTKKEGKSTEPFFWGKEAPKRIIIAVAAMVGFRYSLIFIGFGLSTFLFTLSMVKYLSHYSWKISITLSALMAVGAYYLFEIWLKVPMPTPLLRVYLGF